MASNWHKLSRKMLHTYLRELKVDVQKAQRAREEATFNWQWGQDQHGCLPNILGLPGQWPAVDANEPEDEDEPPAA